MTYRPADLIDFHTPSHPNPQPVEELWCVHECVELVNGIDVVGMDTLQRTLNKNSMTLSGARRGYPLLLIVYVCKGQAAALDYRSRYVKHLEKRSPERYQRQMELDNIPPL